MDLVNAAGAYQSAPSADLDLATFRDILELDLISAFALPASGRSTVCPIDSSNRG